LIGFAGFLAVLTGLIVFFAMLGILDGIGINARLMDGKSSEFFANCYT
jgi:hypothetical protein